MDNRDIITIGSSAGGVELLKELAAGLPADLPAAVFIVQHISPNGPNSLADVLARQGPLPVETAADHQEFQRGAIYVAPPDRHLMIDRSYMYLTRGPHENRVRPAVDPLFRSAAVVHGPHVVGVVLSGNLDDGVAGLSAIKQCGGVAVVQDPKDAPYPEMPQSALDGNPDVDYCVPVKRLPELLTQLAHEPPDPPIAPSEELLTEVQISRSTDGGVAALNEIGELMHLNCSECGGPLWRIEQGKLLRFRCREGHSYTARALDTDLSASIERSMWVAVQAIDDRISMLQHLADYERRKDNQRLAASWEEKAKELQVHGMRLRQVLLSMKQ
jgi:two-component system chemotaxis response regulator CheB